MQTIVPKISFITYSLGCRTNQAELGVISDQLAVIGFTHLGSPNTTVECDSTQYPAFPAGKRTTNINPNLILINTCMVTGKAEKETRKAVRHFRKLYPKSKIVVLGCAVTAKIKYKIDLPDANLLISNEEKSKAVSRIITLVKSVKRYLPYRQAGNRSNDRESQCNVSKPGYEESGRKFIKIQDGCSNCCSFCITTCLRGEPKSEDPEKLIELISELAIPAGRQVNSGIKEIILTGINIGLYGIDLQPRTSIWSLINRILKETKIERLTLSTVYPEMLWDKGSDPVIGRTLMEHIGNTRLTRCFHLALQSGSPGVLRRMNRPTDLKQLLKAINEIRKTQPDFTFKADVITGFPDETEEEHQETLDFIRQAKISFAHVFPYSPRVGTVANEMIRKKKWQEVSPEIKKVRKKEIEKVVEENRNNQTEMMVGKRYRALIIRRISIGNTDSGQVLRQVRQAHYGQAQDVAMMTSWEGITNNGWNVVVTGQSSLVIGKYDKGQFVDVKITGYDKGQLFGEILSLPI